MIYFTSDSHFGHANIIKYTNRPFKNVVEMDEVLIKNWNSIVQKNDTVFFLGDFCMVKSSEAPDSKKDAFNYYRSQLNGNIIFIIGNHDSHNKCKSIIESMIIKYGGKRIYLTHNPKFYQKDFVWNFTGHCHGNNGQFRKVGKSIIVDLSVDCWDFKPVDINTINQAYSIWKKTKNE